MKKQTKKLSLNKKIISNLAPAEMNKKVGGTVWGPGGCGGSYYNCGGTRNGNTCPGHNTCYAC